MQEMYSSWIIQYLSTFFSSPSLLCEFKMKLLRNRRNLHSNDFGAAVEAVLLLGFKTIKMFFLDARISLINNLCDSATSLNELT